MAFYKTVKNLNGTFSTYDFTLEDLAIVGGLQITLVVASFLFFIVLTPILKFFLYTFCGDDNGARTGRSVLGLIYCIYLLLDYHYGWIEWTILGFNFPNFFIFLSKIWFTLAIFFFFTTFFAKRIYTIIRNIKNMDEGNADGIMKGVIFGVFWLAMIITKYYFNLPHYDGESAFWVGSMTALK
jgi:hypothetical protein